MSRVSEQSPASTRPRHTSFALWLVIVSGVVAVMTAYDAMAGLHSLDTREMLEDLVAEPAWAGTGITVATAREMMRWSALITGAGAVAAVILAAYCFKGERPYRLALSAIAVPVTFAGFPIGGFSTTVIGVSALMLWLQPSRAWFNGDPIPEPRSAHDETGGREQHVAGTSAPDAAWAAPDPAARVAGAARPPLSAMRAAILSSVFAGGTMVILLAVTVMLVASPDAILADLRAQDPEVFEQGLSERQVVVALVVMLAMMAAWCAAALVLAYLVVRGKEWARICLAFSAGAAGLIFALVSTMNPLMLVGVLACALTLVQLSRPETARWTRGR